MRPANTPSGAEGERRMDWKTLLAYITGTVDQDLLLCNEYLVTENRILRSQIPGRVRLSHGERKAVGEIGLGRRGGHWHGGGCITSQDIFPLAQRLWP